MGGSATVCPTGLSDWSDRQSDVAWVGPTGRSDDRNVHVNASSDWSDRPVGPTGRSDDRNAQLVYSGAEGGEEVLCAVLNRLALPNRAPTVELWLLDSPSTVSRA